MNDAKSLIIKKTASIIETLKIIDIGGVGTAFIVDNEDKFFGLVTDGDIRRAILDGVSLQSSIIDVVVRNPIVVKPQISKFVR